MAIRKRYVDDSSNELEFYVNKDRKLFLQTGDLHDFNGYNSGIICLDKEDVIDIIKSLELFLSEM